MDLLNPANPTSPLNPLNNGAYQNTEFTTTSYGTSDILFVVSLIVVFVGVIAFVIIDQLKE
jgi:hypothetical protein